MNFEYISLSKKENKRLKQLSKSPAGLPPSPDETTLMEYGLIARTRYGSADSENGAPLKTLSMITAKGNSYLTYERKKDQARRKEHTHNWLIAIFSVVCGALLSEPLWTLIRLIISWFSEKQ